MHPSPDNDPDPAASGPPARFSKDTVGAALMMVLGLGAMAEAARHPLGTLQRMGPGLFPMALGAVLALAGCLILMTARLAHRPPRHAAQAPEWRGWICICAALLAFIVLGHWGGLVPATVALVFISAMGDRKNTVKSALVLTAILLVVCVVVFWWGLRMNFPLWRWG